MPSLSKVAWGFLLVYVDFRIEELDVVPDVLGWALVLAGLGPLAGRSGWFRLAAGAAWLGLAAAVFDIVAPPNLLGTAAEGVAQTTVSVAVCTAVLALVGDPGLRRRAGLIRGWSLAFGAVGVLLSPMGEVEATGDLIPVVLVLVVASLVLLVVWLRFLFALARSDTAPAPPLAVP